MLVKDIQQILELWAPKELAWERDNAGLQIGSLRSSVKRVLVALDVTDGVVDEAKRLRADVIVSHHPLLFHPVRRVDEDDRVGRLLLKLARSGIAVYAAHTNLDFAPSGVSTALAGRLGLSQVEVLAPQRGLLKKIVVFVPASHADKVMASMAAAGAGQIGKYEECSFRMEGTGTFKGKAGSRPYVGKAGRMERVQEIRLEMVVPTWAAARVVAAMHASHPYEEIAYDLYGLENEFPEAGAGAIGNLDRAMSLDAFLGRARRSLGTPALRYAGDSRRRVRRVAVCGGSGSDLLPDAIRRGADAFLTADISYHTFERADGSIALIDAGHYETEQPIVRKVAHYLKSEVARRKERVSVFESKRSRNPVQYHLS